VKIRMLEERTGPRHDGRMWPPLGGEIDVDDEEGAAVCAAGWAQPVAAERKAETRPAPDTAEKRTAAKKQ
jgi:hypothetical protein